MPYTGAKAEPPAMRARACPCGALRGMIMRILTDRPRGPNYERNTVPNIKAAIKWTRASEKRRKRNLAVTSKLKTLAKKAGVAGATAADVKTAASAFDKAAVRGIIHKNKANRKKSRMAKRANAPKAKA